MLASAFLGQREDFLGAEPELVAPAADVEAGGPTLLTAGEGGRIEAEAVEKLIEQPIEIGRALYVLLLLCGFP